MVVAIIRSSTYCRRISSPGGAVHPSRSLANWFPKMVGLFSNPCGSTVQVNCDFLPVSGSSHSKANGFWLSGSKGRQQKASFKPKTVNHTYSSSSLVNSVYGLATTGWRSSTILLMALRSCTNLYSFYRQAFALVILECYILIHTLSTTRISKNYRSLFSFPCDPLI